MQRYDPSTIEPKWQKIWEETGLYEVAEDPKKEKIYATPMLPYPSGAGLHVGHVRNYSIADTVARFYRQRGYNVMSNMGWDSFGLPAENYAIKTGVPPWKTTQTNIASFKNQLKRLGMSYAWDREVDTSSPEYYKWTQWIFTQLFNEGLAYQAENSQWWCPECKTVLANEQVVNGCCWRHEDTPVIKKRLKQWFFKITDYADELLDATDGLDWPESIKSMQKNWIGRSEGAEIQFAVKDADETLSVFTTRPDTIFGATFMVVAPEHPLLEGVQDAAVQSYINESVQKSDIDRMNTDRAKTGVFSGLYAINPASQEEIPIWVADYVLAGYGTGAIMAVPAHDQRDYEFAKKFDLAIKKVIEPKFIAESGDSAVKEGEDFVKREAICAVVRNPADDTYLCISWKNHPMRGLVTGGLDTGEDPVEAAKREVLEETGYKNLRLVDDPELYIHSLFYHRQKNQNRWARFHYLFFELENEERDTVDKAEAALLDAQWIPKDKLLDYFTVIEGQYLCDILEGGTKVYAGEGIIVNSGKYDGLDSAQGRVKIVADLAKTNQAKQKVQYKIRDWLISRQRYWGAPIPIIHCADCGAVPVPDDQLPVVLPEIEDFKPTGTSLSVLASVTEWVNVPCPTCTKPAKRETDTMDGYVCSSWYMYRYADAHNAEQAFSKSAADYWMPVDFYFGGDHAVSHLLYFRFFHRFFAKHGLIGSQAGMEPVKKLVYNGYINAQDGRKMSKSLGNVVDPLEIIDSGYGADALRMFELFVGPYDQDVVWNPNGVPGTYRFIQRVWSLVEQFVETADLGTASPVDNKTEHEATLLSALHKTIQKVTRDLDRLSFNTAVASLMEFVNTANKVKEQLPINSASTTWRQVLEQLLQLLAPFTPHVSEELWRTLGHDESIHVAGWPAWDEALVADELVTIAVQVNGKVRSTLSLAVGTSKEEILAVAQEDEAVQKHIAGKSIKKTIVVPNKIINFVV